MKKNLLLFLTIFVNYSLLFSQTVIDVNRSYFLEDGSSVTITKVNCTLNNGTQTTCYEIVSNGMPTDHNMGPWCPDNISDDASAGGIWLEGGEVYDVDGAFIQNMANFYNDNTWLMYDANGDIYTTETETDCANAANPNVGEEYENFCVECLPSYVTDLSQTYLIPITPVEVNTPIQFGGMGPPGQGNNGPSVRGVAFNGVRYDAAAPTNAILGAYTLAPFDDAGGHINLNAGYHYHAATGESKEIAQSDGHAPLIGYALDGHGIYGHFDDDGNEATGLDQCRGHYDATRGYHYHVDYAGNNNFIDCLYGAYATASGTEIEEDVCIIPAGITSTIISGNVAKITWTINADAERYRIRYKEAGGSWTEKLTAGTENFRFLNGLTPNTVYTYQVKTLCSFDNSVWSPDYTFTTLGDVCDIPTSSTATSLSSTSVQIDWNANTGDEKYKLKYRPTTGGSWIEYSSLATNTKTETGLVAATEYRYKLKTKCAEGWTNWSANATFTTPNSFGNTNELTTQSFYDDSTVSLNVYPNPVTNGNLNLNVLTDSEFKGSISIHNINGQEVFTNVHYFTSGMNLIPIRAEWLSGIYFIAVANNDKVLLTEKVIVN